jgi:hypothetical protein
MSKNGDLVNQPPLSTLPSTGLTAYLQVGAFSERFRAENTFNFF